MTSKLLVFWKTGREERWSLTRLYTVYIIVSLILVLFCVFVCLFVCLFSQFVSHSDSKNSVFARGKIKPLCTASGNPPELR